MGFWSTGIAFSKAKSIENGGKLSKFSPTACKKEFLSQATWDLIDKRQKCYDLGLENMRKEITKQIAKLKSL